MNGALSDHDLLELDEAKAAEIAAAGPELVIWALLKLSAIARQQAAQTPHASTPSAQIPPFKKSSGKRKPRGRGRNAGHEGAHREKPPRFDRREEHTLTTCPHCGVKVERVPWALGKHRLTTAFAWFLAGWAKRLLWLGEQRKAKTLLKFFRWFGPERSAQLRFICSDMWKGYIKVIAKKAGAAVHILDRFHIMANLGKALDEVRAQEARALKAQGQGELLKHSRWCFLKRPENLTDTQSLKLADLLRWNLKIVRAYLLKEQFQVFWDYVSPAWAGKFLDQWTEQALRSRIEPLKRFACTLRRHRELLLNYFRARKRFSAGVVEGLNNKAKTTMKNDYGYRTFESLQVALYHTLGDLPEPKITHSFL